MRFPGELPADVWRVIYDNINPLPSELKTLCLTSKAFRKLTNPCLYEKITLNVHDDEDMSKFFKAMDAGGKYHLEHTRKLTLCDNYAPEEALSLQPGRLNFDSDRGSLLPSSRKLDPKVAKNIKKILEYLPNNFLNTFRFISQHALDIKSMEILVDGQVLSLEHLHASYQSDPDANALWNKVGRQPSIKTLDLWISEGQEVDHLGHLLATSSPHLKRIFLGRALDTHGGEYLSMPSCKPLWEAITQSEQSTTKQLRITALSLYSLDVRDAFTPLTKLVDIQALTHLTLWGLASLKQFLMDLEASIRGSELRLRHLALAINPLDTLYIDQPLSSIFDHAPHLESLHLKWKHHWDEEYRPVALLDKISSIGKNLRSLSLHYRNNSEGPTFETVPVAPSLEYNDFVKICAALPNLEQLGYQIHENCLYDLDDFEELTAIAKLASIRILHFPQVFGEPRAVEFALASQRERNWELTRFANNIFEYLDANSLCPKLEAICIGREWQPLHAFQVEMPTTPLHCFIKGQQRDMWGRTTTIAVQVPSYLLRHYMGKGAEILDWHSDWEHPSAWMSRVPGRFNDY